MTDRRFPLFLNTGINYVVDWLTRPIYGGLSIQMEHGRINVDRGRAVNRGNGEIVVAMSGPYIVPSPHDPSAERVAEPKVTVIEFFLTRLSSTRVELTAACYHERAETYLANVLREIERRWGEPAPAISPPPTPTDEGRLQPAASPASSTCCVLAQWTAALLRQRYIELRGGGPRLAQPDLAAALGVHRSTLHTHLKDHIHLSWKDLRASRE